MNTLDYILNKFKLSFNDKTRMPIEIPNIGRDNLPSLFRELGFKTGAEVGVYLGDYSEKLCKGNQNLKLYYIDPWEGYHIYDSDVSKKAYITAQEKLREYNCKLIKKTSAKAVKEFADGSLDFVYIDGNHEFNHVIEDIMIWSKKVRIGGIISGHDYIRFKNFNHQVVEAVLAYVSTNNIFPWFLLGSRKANHGMIRDKHRSFMWVK